LLAALLVALILPMGAEVPAGGMRDWEPPAKGVPSGLASQADSALQGALEALVREQGLEEHVSSGRLALGLVDISDLDAPRFAAVNPDRMMYAASLPKIAILLGAFVKIAAGELVHDELLEADMVAMIRQSDNPAATRVLERVGRDDLIEILVSAPFRLYDPAAGGGLWVGKDYAKGEAYRRDPLNNLSHGATVRQVARFFYLLERGELVGPRYDAEMKRILSQPEIRHKFVAGLASRPSTQLYRKSGTWRAHHADAALVEAGEHTYVIVGLARHADGGDWLARLAAPMHDLVVARSMSTSNITD
jgi:beta-lactamase class A